MQHCYFNDFNLRRIKESDVSTLLLCALYYEHVSLTRSLCSPPFVPKHPLMAY